ncbi:MAG: HAMP domain-containing histidine kinase, partial [Caulobacteraceae bacterium]|nr:HAMP domain-containing histidine kinase [Caulobacter sp.]
MRRAERRATALWRTTVFRFTTVACVVVALGVMALLGLIYARTSVELDARSDAILARARAQLLPSTAEALPRRIDRLLAANPSRSLHVALFSTTGALVAGDIAAPPPRLAVDGVARDVVATRRTPELRALALTTPWGERLVIGRDAAALLQVRAVLLRALVWSGLAIAGLGLLAATLLSLHPLRRLRELEATGRLIAGGRLDLRMPVSRRRDELDLFAGVVNAMVGEIARLVDEVRSTTDAVAHDLRTPLTRVRARLHRLAHDPAAPAQVCEAAEDAIADLDQVLERFAALLRISELESQNRRAGFGPFDLARLVEEGVELYGPLAEESGVRLT